MVLVYKEGMATFAERLQEALDAKGWSQGKLARAVGVTQGAISQILLGKTHRSKFLPEIAEELGVSMRWLAGEDVSRDPTVPLPPRPQPALNVVMMGVAMPPEYALARMFEGLLAGIDPKAPRDEQALLLAQRLPIGLSQLRDLLPDSVTAMPRRLERPEADATRAMPHHEPTQ